MSDNNRNSDILLSFLKTLAGHGRTDCYSRFNVRVGKGYTLSDEEVSRGVIAAHLSGEQPIAIYLFAGETTKLAALDIDNHGGELDWEQVAVKIRPLVADLVSRGMRPFVVRSGGGSGLHVWLVWQEPQRTRDVRRFLKQVLEKHGFKDGTAGIAAAGIEIYPKRDSVLDGKFGNPIALPFSRRSVPLNDDLLPVQLDGYLPPAFEDLYVPGIESTTEEDAAATGALRPRMVGAPTVHGVLLTGDDTEASAALRCVRADDHGDWIRIGFVLKHSFGSAGFCLWDNWSKTSKKYPGTAVCQDVWDGLKPDGTVGIGTLFYMAQQGGWNGPSDPEIRDMNAKYGIVTLGTKTMIVEKQIVGNGDTSLAWVTKEVLKDRYRSKTVIIPDGSGGQKQMQLVDFWLGNTRADHYRWIDFNPDLPPGGNGNMYNIWKGFAVLPAPGDWSLLKDHIAYNICNQDSELNEWLLNWLALGVQQPGYVIGTAPVLSGIPGVGKGVLAHSYGSLWGPHYTTITHQAHVSGRFNAHLVGRRFIYIDEGMWGGNRQDAGNIKTRITEPYITMEAKGIDPIRVRNRSIYMIASNEDSIVPADHADRRWQVFKVGERNREDKAYFKALMEQLNSGGREAMLHDLLTRDISCGPDPRRIIKTAGLFDQILHSQGPVFRYIFQMLDDGLLPQPWAPGNGPGATTIRAMYEDMQATQPNAKFVLMRNFGRKLNDVFPGTKTVQSGIFIEGQGAYAVRSRSTRYQFPPLSQCRKDFEKYAGQAVPWSNENGDWLDGRVDGGQGDNTSF